MDRRKQIYLAVMVVGGLALVVDRCVLPEATAPAAVKAAGGGSTPGPAPAKPAPATPPIPAVPFPRGLKPFDPALPLRDLFAPPFETEKGNRERTVSTPSKRDPSPVIRDMFVTRHRLEGVFRDEGLRIAIIDGVWVRIGQAVDGCTLMKLEGTRAHFACEDGEAVLDVAHTALRGPH